MTHTPNATPPNGRVLVTGASGTVGSAVAEQLVRAGQSVVSAVRDPSDARIPLGTTPTAFSFTDPTGWPAAFEGVDRLFLLRPPAIADVASTLIPVIDVALERGIRQIVFLSLQGVQFNTRTPHHAVEQHLRERKAPFTFLRPNFFMQNLSTVYRDDIRLRSEIFLPAASARTAYIDARDIGRVAARVFTEPGHLGRAYTLSGEQSLGYRDVAKIMTDVLGRPIEYRRPSVPEYVARLEADGAAADYIAVQKMIYQVVRLNVSAFPSRAIRRLTGQPATSFRQFVQDNRRLWM